MSKKILPFLIQVFGALCFALVFIVIFVNATQVDCVLQSDGTYTCQLQTQLLGRFPVRTRTIENVVSITSVQDSCDEGCSYRAEFITAAGEQVPLTEVYKNEGPVLQQVNTLQPQLDSRVDTFSYTSRPPWWIILLVGGLSGIWILISSWNFLRKR